jgi:hypothetical protein
MMRTSQIFGVLGLAFLLSSCGSAKGPQLGTVTGVVSMDGKPLANARVVFTPIDEGRGSVGVTNESGRYSLEFAYNQKGAAVGEHTVQIFSESYSGEGPSDPVISPEFNSASTLKAHVKPGRNSFDFSVTSTSRRP